MTMVEFYNLIFNGLIYGLFAAIAAIFLTPLQYIKIQRQEFQLSYSEIVKNTIKNHTNKIGIFFCGWLPYVMLNFISSASFGVFDYFSNVITRKLQCCMLTVIIVRTFVGGLGETFGTIYFEIKEVIQNKEMQDENAKTSFVTILILIFLRNAIAWLAAILVYELGEKYHFSQMQAIMFSCILGIIFGILTTPFDVLITRNCGVVKKESLCSQIYHIIFKSKYDETFSGAIIRFIQIGIYSVVTLLTMIFLKYVG